MMPLFTVTTNSPEQTKALGKAIGHVIDSKTIIAMVGDLGSGKTIFVQGLAVGMGISPETYITSPTYTLINEYQGRMPLYHADFYRLNEADEEVEHLGFTDLLNKDAVVAIEWADRLDHLNIGDHLMVAFTILKNDQRTVTLTAYGPSYQILLKEIETIYGALVWD